MGWPGGGPAAITAEVTAFLGPRAFRIATSGPRWSVSIGTRRRSRTALYEIRVVFRDASSEVVGQLTRQVLVNNSVVWHAGGITADETWTSDRVHVVEDNVTVAAGVTA